MSQPALIFQPVATSSQLLTTTALAGSLLFVLAIIFLGIFFKLAGNSRRYLFLGVSCFVFLLLIASLRFRVRSYEINSGTLIVHLGFGEKSFTLTGLQDTSIVNNPFAGARKVAASGGMWSFCGHFRSAAVGDFQAYAAQTSQGVLLTWPDKKVLLTPANTEQFITSLKAPK